MVFFTQRERPEEEREDFDLTFMDLMRVWMAEVRRVGSLNRDMRVIFGAGRCGIARKP